MPSDDLDLTELRAVAERLSPHWQSARRSGKSLMAERALAGDHFNPDVVLALIDRVEQAEAAVERVRALLSEPVMSDWARRYWSGRHDSHQPMMAVTLEDYRDRTLAALDGDA